MSAWFAIYVQSRHERVVATILNAKGLETCLPLVYSRRAWSDRTKWLEVPAFPGYVFARVETNSRAAVLATPGVVRIVGSGKFTVPIPQEEMDALRTLERAGAQAERWTYLSDGERVCIKGGPFDGLTGILSDSRKQAHVVVSVSILQRSVAVQISREQLIPLQAAYFVHSKS